MRGRKQDLSSSPHTKRKKMDERKLEDTTRAKGRDKTIVVEEQMDQGTMEGAAYPRGRRWRKARRAKPDKRNDKGTTEKCSKSVILKECNGNTVSKRKREEENDSQGAQEDRPREQECETVPNGEEHRLKRPENVGGAKVQNWGRTNARGRKKRKVQTNKITNYFENPVGLMEDEWGTERRLLKLKPSNLTLSVKPDRPRNIIVFEEGFANKIRN